MLVTVSQSHAIAPRPVRTLVVSRDLAFREHAMTVLGDLGHAAFAVASADAIDEVVSLVAQERPDVVVLDATACGSAVAGVMRDLRELAPGVGVVLASSHGDESDAGDAISKWGPAGELSRAVLSASWSPA